MNTAADMKPPLFPGLIHFFTSSLVLFCPLSTVHCSLSFVIQITVSSNSPIFSVQSNESKAHDRFFICNSVRFRTLFQPDYPPFWQARSQIPASKPGTHCSAGQRLQVFLRKARSASGVLALASCSLS